MRKLSKTPDFHRDQKRYRALHEIHPKLPVFFQPWWLDAVAGADNWGAVIVDGKRDVEGVLPYIIKKRPFAGISLGMPPLTQTLGPWINIPEGTKAYRKLSIEKKVMTALIDGLPQFASYSQKWIPEVTNWHPFYWKEFSQTTWYTYVLPCTEKADVVWGSIEQKTRKNIRRAMDTHGVKTVWMDRAPEMWGLIEDTYRRQSLSVPYGKDFFERLQDASLENGSGKNIVAYVGNIPVAAGFFVWDEKKMYYLVSGTDMERRETHALSLVLWEGIKLAIEKGLAFDFEGTMLENVEPYFRSFGAEQISYSQVWKVPSLLGRIKKAFALVSKGCI